MSGVIIGWTVGVTVGVAFSISVVVGILVYVILLFIEKDTILLDVIHSLNNKVKKIKNN